MLGSLAQSDCAILEFSSLLRVTCESPVLHPCPPVTPFCAECPAFPSPRHTHPRSCLWWLLRPAGSVAFPWLPSVVLLGSVVPSETCPGSLGCHCTLSDLLEGHLGSRATFAVFSAQRLWSAGTPSSSPFCSKIQLCCWGVP